MKRLLVDNHEPRARQRGHVRRAVAVYRSLIDAGIVEGAEVRPFYDPLLAKIIAHGGDRAAARARLLGALRETTLLGVHIAPVPSGRFVLERRLLKLGFLDTRFALRINGTPVDGAIAYGGGAGLALRLPLSDRLDLQGGAAGDLMLLDGEKKFLPYLEVGVRAHF